MLRAAHADPGSLGEGFGHGNVLFAGSVNRIFLAEKHLLAAADRVRAGRSHFDSQPAMGAVIDTRDGVGHDIPP